jgi:hypothetical protein
MQYTPLLLFVSYVVKKKIGDIYWNVKETEFYRDKILRKNFRNDDAEEVLGR